MKVDETSIHTVMKDLYKIPKRRKIEEKSDTRAIMALLTAYFREYIRKGLKSGRTFFCFTLEFNEKIPREISILGEYAGEAWKWRAGQCFSQAAKDLNLVRNYAMCTKIRSTVHVWGVFAFASEMSALRSLGSRNDERSKIYLRRKNRNPRKRCSVSKIQGLRRNAKKDKEKKNF